MRLDVLCESHEALLEDGEAASPAAVGDAVAASAVGPIGVSVPGVNTTADIALHPTYLGLSARGGKLTISDSKRKRKSLHEEALNSAIDRFIAEVSSKLG